MTPAANIVCIWRPRCEFVFVTLCFPHICRHSHTLLLRLTESSIISLAEAAWYFLMGWNDFTASAEVWKVHPTTQYLKPPNFVTVCVFGPTMCIYLCLLVTAFLHNVCVSSFVLNVIMAYWSDDKLTCRCGSLPDGWVTCFFFSFTLFNFVLLLKAPLSLSLFHCLTDRLCLWCGCSEISEGKQSVLCDSVVRS